MRSHTRPSFVLPWLLLPVVACSPDRDDPAAVSGGLSSSGTAGASAGTATQGAATQGKEPSMTAGGTASSSAGTASMGDDDSGDPMTRLDVAPPIDMDPPPPANGRCSKIDFLFVIDASLSMEDEQAKLAQSFPGFIAAIRNKVGVNSFHILATDTDAMGKATFALTTVNGQAVNSCPTACHSPRASWQNTCCQPPPGGMISSNLQCPQDPEIGCWKQFAGMEACDVALGAGRRFSSAGTTCNVLEGRRYLTDAQPNLEPTFECAAKVGNNGSNAEFAIDAALSAIKTDMVKTGGCNDGFLRSDAVLVITFITDEPNQSAGTPKAWWDQIVAAKHGNPEAAVLVGIYDPAMNQGFSEFVGLAPKGFSGDIASSDYASVFAQAIEGIDYACSVFTPPR